MFRILVRSRRGNVVLAVLGAFYSLAAVMLLAWSIADVWLAASMTDRLVQICLVAAAACGVWFVAIAMRNLGGSVGFRPFARRSPAMRWTAR